MKSVTPSRAYFLLEALLFSIKTSELVPGLELLLDGISVPLVPRVADLVATRWLLVYGFLAVSVVSLGVD